MNVFLTGATGFIGLNIVNALIKSGHVVTCYTREQSNIFYLEKFPVTIRKGSLCSIDELVAAMNGCDAIIHTAGNTSCNKSDLRILQKTNVEGTRCVIEAAKICGIKRIVYTSTTSTVGAEDDPSTRSNAETIIKGFRAKSPYAQTKLAAEKLLVQSMEAGIEPIILNPAEVIGGFDHNLQWGRMVLAVAAGQLPFIPPGSGSFCSAGDVAKAHVNALEKGTPGKRYILAGKDASYSEFISTIGEVVGTTPVPVRNIPFWFLRLENWFKERTYPIFKRAPVVEAYRMKVFNGHYFFDSNEAEAALEYKVSSLKDMVNDSFQWYRQHQYI